MVPSNTVAAEVDEEATTEEAGAALRSKARRSDRPIGHGDEEAARRERRAAPRDDTGMRRLARCRAACGKERRAWWGEGGEGAVTSVARQSGEEASR